MVTIPAKVEKRLNSAVRKFQDTLNNARERDANEADTVTIITGMLAEVFGFDRYSEITKEYKIQGNYKCDLAVRPGGKVAYLIEVKAVETNLSDKYIKQVVTYASREGIGYVVLTNGIKWQIHRVTASGKVKNEMILEMDFLSLNPRRSKEDQENLFLLCKEGFQKNALNEHYEHSRIFSPYTVGALLLEEPVLRAVRKELRRLKSGMKVSDEQIEELMRDKVLKRDILDSESAAEAKKLITRSAKRQKRAASEKSKEATNSHEPQEMTSPNTAEGNMPTRGTVEPT